MRSRLPEKVSDASEWARRECAAYSAECAENDGSMPNGAWTRAHRQPSKQDVSTRSKENHRDNREQSLGKPHGQGRDSVSVGGVHHPSHSASEGAKDPANLHCEDAPNDRLGVQPFEKQSDNDPKRDTE
jgi:hypothetical protein